MIYSWHQSTREKEQASSSRYGRRPVIVSQCRHALTGQTKVSRPCLDVQSQHRHYACLHRDTLNKIAALICHLYPPPIHRPIFLLLLFTVYLFIVIVVLLYLNFSAIFVQLVKEQTLKPQTLEQQKARARLLETDFFFQSASSFFVDVSFYLCVCFFHLFWLAEKVTGRFGSDYNGQTTHKESQIYI